MAENNSSPTSNTTSITASAAGAGSGTLLVLLANNLPAVNPWKSWLLIVAPSATIAIAFLWRALDAAVSRYLRKRELRSVVLQAQATLKAALENGNTSAQHRSKLKHELKQLELLLVQTDVEKIKALRVYR